MKQRDKYINREINMECISCGISIKEEIIKHKARVHLCRRCREFYMDKETGGRIN